MALQRDRLLAKYHPEILAERIAAREAVPDRIPLVPAEAAADRCRTIAQEEAIVLDHDYDGVHELDNNLPPWWKGLFYATIAFAPIYLYFTIQRFLPVERRRPTPAEMTLAEARSPPILKTQENVLDESNVPLLAEATPSARDRSSSPPSAPPATARPPRGHRAQPDG